MTPVGFPHSDIHGSRPAFGFPWLFVDRYVLLRLPVPRHPPCALFSLTCPSVSLKTGVFQSRSNHFWVLLAVHTPCSSMCIPKFKDTFVRSTQTLFCLASHSSLFRYSVFKVLLAEGGSRFTLYVSYIVSAYCLSAFVWPRFVLSRSAGTSL